jgi:hypothetical protein
MPGVIAALASFYECFSPSDYLTTRSWSCRVRVHGGDCQWVTEQALARLSRLDPAPTGTTNRFTQPANSDGATTDYCIRTKEAQGGLLLPHWQRGASWCSGRRAKEPMGHPWGAVPGAAAASGIGGLRLAHSIPVPECHRVGLAKARADKRQQPPRSYPLRYQPGDLRMFLRCSLRSTSLHCAP